jgi:hypothetical protein
VATLFLLFADQYHIAAHQKSDASVIYFQRKRRAHRS